MRRLMIIACLSVPLLFGGCENHQAKVDSLQKESDRLGDQFQRDCAGEMLNIPPKLSPKCQAEKDQQAEAWKRLQDERAKK